MAFTTRFLFLLIAFVFNYLGFAVADFCHAKLLDELYSHETFMKSISMADLVSQHTLQVLTKNEFDVYLLKKLGARSISELGISTQDAHVLEAYAKGAFDIAEALKKCEKKDEV